MKNALAAGLALSVIGLASGAAQAAPLGAKPGVAEGDAALIQVHGGHPSCQSGPAGWHYHYRGGRFVCSPRPRGNVWIWRNLNNRWGWWHPRERRWHR